MTEIGYDAFFNCDGLTQILIPKSLQSITGWQYEYGIFRYCDNLRTVEFENGMTTIPSYIMMGCTGLTTVIIPNTVTSIGNGAFSSCSPNLNGYCAKYSYPTLYFIDNGYGSVSTNDVRLKETAALDETESHFTVTSGAKLRVSCTYSIKDKVFTKGRDYSIKIHIPDGAEIEDGSLYMGNTLLTEYTERDGYLSVPVSGKSGKITFNLETEGDCKLRTYALLNYTLNGQSGYDIINIINEDVDLISLDAEDVASSEIIKVSGIAPAKKTVDLYIDDVKVKTLTANKSGVYSGEITVTNPENETEYTIKAISSDNSNNEITAEKAFVYRENAPELTSFTMSYRGKTYDLTSGLKSSIVFAPGNAFRFEVKYKNNGNVGNVYVTSTRNQITKRMKATYDESAGAFIAEGFFDDSNHSYVPGRINVEFTPRLEEGFLNSEMNFDYEDLPEQYQNAQVTVNENTDSLYDTSVKVSDSESYRYTQKNYSSVDELSRELFPEEYSDEETDESHGKNVESVGAEYDLEEELLKDLFQKAKKKFGENVISNAEDLVEEENKSLYAILKDDLHKSLKVIIFDALDDSLKSVSITFTGAYFLNGQSFDQWAQATQTWGLLYGEARTLWYALHDVQRFNQIESEIRLDSSLNETEKAYALEKFNQTKWAYGGLYVLKFIAPVVNTAIAAQCGPFAPLILTGLNFVENMLFDLLENHLEVSLMHYKSGGKGSLFNWSIDPSGYIYSGNEDNRVQGATVTAYWIPFDEEDELYWDSPDESKAVIWDSGEYSQINPLITDNDGNYAWDVPEGWWRVVAEKDGYITYTTEWLPVPPPQTEVNINLKRIGDTNLDGKVNVRDVTAIQRHVAELETFNEEQLAVTDTNGDGEINISDATHLQMYLAEYDVVLGKQS